MESGECGSESARLYPTLLFSTVNCRGGGYTRKLLRCLIWNRDTQRQVDDSDGGPEQAANTAVIAGQIMAGSGSLNISGKP